MALIVAKFGGTSVADIARIENAASKIVREVEAGNKVVVVVSAMAGVTNQLIDYCDQMSKVYDLREYDAIVSSGEQITAGLMAMALQKNGVQARSWMGWQIPIQTNDIHGKARIENIDTDELHKRLNDGEVAVVPGFQGVSNSNRISTLGRGGSDTTAVALASALKADRCDIYTDVDGVYTTDPRIVPEARKIHKISYEEMLELASLGSKVLQTRSVEIGAKNGVPIQVLSSFADEIGSDRQGTLVTIEEHIMEQELVSGIAHNVNEAQISIMGLDDVPGVAARVFEPLANASVNVNMIVQNVSHDGKVDITFSAPLGETDLAVETLKSDEGLNFKDLIVNKDVAIVSIVGIGMNSSSGVANKMFKTLSDNKINIKFISTSEIKISVLIDKEHTELAVKSLHKAYDLEEERT